MGAQFTISKARAPFIIVALLLGLVAASLLMAPAALAEPMPPDYEFMGEDLDMDTAFRIGGYRVFTAVAAKGGQYLEEDAPWDAGEDGEPVLHALPANALVLLLHDAGGGDRSGGAHLLYGDKLQFFAVNPETNTYVNLKKRGAEKLRFHPVPQAKDEEWMMGRTEKQLTVYEKASSSSKKLGIIPADGNAVFQTGSRYDIVAFGGALGYVRSGMLETVDEFDMFTNWYKNRGNHLADPGWDYGGLVDGDRNISLREYDSLSSFGVITSLPVKKAKKSAPDGYIYEHHFTARKSPDIMLDCIREDGYYLTSYPSGCMDELYVLSFPLDLPTTFYTNGEYNTLIYYSGDDKTVLQALEDTHGEPVHVIEKGQAGDPKKDPGYWY